MIFQQALFFTLPLLPVLILMLDFSLRGTYDVLAVPLLLPEHVVRDVLLPPSLSAGLLPVPPHVYQQLGLADAVHAADGTPQRLVLLQLGYQSHTGPGAPWMGMRMQSFSEVKLEIPFMRHPKLAQSEQPFLFKQTMLFSNPLMSFSSNIFPGARSVYASFQPKKSPATYAPDAAQIEYGVTDWVQVEARQAAAPRAEGMWPAVSGMLNAPWFAERSGSSVIQFQFDDSAAEIAPKLYDVEVKLRMRAWRHPLQKPYSGPEEILLSAQGFRSKMDFTSRSGTAQKFIE